MSKTAESQELEETGRFWKSSVALQSVLAFSDDLKSIKGAGKVFKENRAGAEAELDGKVGILDQAVLDRLQGIMRRAGAKDLENAADQVGRIAFVLEAVRREPRYEGEFEEEKRTADKKKIEASKTVTLGISYQFGQLVSEGLLQKQDGKLYAAMKRT